jgi:hypothetical protein
VLQNGETNQKSGIYKTVCCGAEIVISPGAVFPDCPNHQKLTTIWKPVVEEKIISQTANKSEPDPGIEPHIENRRLFNAAAGTLSLAPWEQGHLHDCRVCQGVLNFLINQPIKGAIENLRKPADAA